MVKKLSGETEGSGLRILTWNISKKEYQRELAVEIINQINADIVFLQEPTEAWQEHLLRRLSGRYIYNDFHINGDRDSSGLSWFSRLPMHNIAFIPSPVGWHGGWIKRFDTPFGRLQILGVHLRPSTDGKERFTLREFFTSGDDQIVEISEYMRHTKSDMPLIVLGDFNANRGRAVKYIIKRGLKNALPQFSRFAKTYRAGGRLFGISARIDHIFYTPDLHCSHARIIRANPSDHQPLVAVFCKKQ